MLIGHQPKEFLLAVEALTVSFDGFKAVNDLSFYVEENEIRVIIGPNGAGKTTVLDLICGKTRATSGSIQFRGKELTKLKENEIVQAGVGRKFQTPSVFEDLTVFENLEISYPRGRTVFGSLTFQRDAAVKARVEEVAEMIFLKDRLDTYADQLSHGQKQWLEIGMLLMQDPELLMLDEPVAGMSVSRARQDGRTAQPHLQGPLGDRDRARHEVRRGDRPQGHRAAPGKDPVGRHDGQGPERSEGHRSLSRALREQRHVGNFGSSRRLRPERGAARPQRSVAPNEIVAIMGRNGMGKTTLFKSLMGILPTRSGSVSMEGVELIALPSYARVAKGIAYVPQGRMIFSTLTVKENIETGLENAAAPDDARGHLRIVPGAVGHERRRGGNLSGGQQQQLAIARALVTNPKVLLLDEPTEGIQPSIIKDIAQALNEIREERDLSIVVSEQVLSFALDVADRLFVIENGELVPRRPARQRRCRASPKYLSV